MKELCLQLLIFMKNKDEEKELYKFLKKYKGETLISVPVTI